MVGGQVSPIISIIIKNNNNNNNNNDDDDNDDNNNNNNNNNNNSLNGFEQALIDCAFKSSMLTSTVAFRLQTLCGEVQRAIPMRTTWRPCRNEIVFLRVRVRNNRTLYWNLAAIRIIGLSAKVRCSSGER